MSRAWRTGWAASVAAIYPTGGAIGRLLQRLVEREGIDSVTTPSHVETRENFTAYEKETGEQYRFVLPGSALHRAEWEACLDKLATLPEKPKIRGGERSHSARRAGGFLRARLPVMPKNSAPKWWSIPPALRSRRRWPKASR